jgi:hypothetical protein
MPDTRRRSRPPSCSCNGPSRSGWIRAEPRFRPVKPAGNGYPKKNSQARRRNNSSSTRCRKNRGKSSYCQQQITRGRNRSGLKRNKLRWELEKKVVGPSIKHHSASVDSLHGRFLHFVPGPATRPTFAQFQGSSVLACRFHLGFTRRITRLYRRREIRKHHERRINFLDDFAVGFGGLLHRLPLGICAERFPVRGRRVAAGMR